VGSGFLLSENKCRGCNGNITGICVVVADAAAYFTSVSPLRCKQNALQVLALRKQKGFDKIFYDPKTKSHSKLGKHDVRPPTGWVAMSFDEIENGIRFFTADNIFRAGALCVERCGGLPMGGALSPPLATFDLEKSILEQLYEHKILVAKQWVRKGECASRHLQCRLYVDDAVFWSHTICNKCLESLLPQLVPSDVGLEVEHSSMGPAEVAYLHAVLHTRVPTADNKSFFDVRPLLHNERFAFGLDDYPRVAKLEAFMGPRYSKYMDVRPFVFARLVTFETTFKSENPTSLFVSTHAQRSLQCLVLEVLRMRWPLRMLSNCLAEFPFYRRNWFSAVVRTLGIQLRKCDILVLWCGDETAYFHTFDPVDSVSTLVAKVWSHVVCEK
jgi:hypothetical protein